MVDPPSYLTGQKHQSRACEIGLMEIVLKRGMQESHTDEDYSVLT